MSEITAQRHALKGLEGILVGGLIGGAAVVSRYYYAPEFADFWGSDNARSLYEHFAYTSSIGMIGLAFGSFLNAFSALADSLSRIEEQLVPGMYGAATSTLVLALDLRWEYSQFQERGYFQWDQVALEILGVASALTYAYKEPIFQYLKKGAGYLKDYAVKYLSTKTENG